LAVAGPYLAKLIDRSPRDSERLMVSLVDLGLRLEALMFLAGLTVGGEDYSVSEIENGIAELAAAVEVVQLILDGELPMMDEEELANLSKLEGSPKGDEGSSN